MLVLFATFLGQKVFIGHNKGILDHYFYSFRPNLSRGALMLSMLLDPQDKKLTKTSVKMRLI